MFATKLTSPSQAHAAPTPLGQATIVSCADPESREALVRERIAVDLALAVERVTEHPQVMWLELTKASYGREAITQILHELNLATFTPDQSRYVVFTQAQRLTPEAANALLKVMEEPPADVHFLLLVDTVAHVMPTLRSRSRVWAISVGAASSKSELGTQFFRADVPARFGLIAVQKERSDLQALYAAVLDTSHQLRDYASASWLMQRAGYVAGSGNVRLLLETFVLRAGEGQA